MVVEDLYEVLKVPLRYRRLRLHRLQSMRQDNELRTKSTAQYAVDMCRKISIHGVMDSQRIYQVQRLQQVQLWSLLLCSTTFGFGASIEFSINGKHSDWQK